MLSGLVVNNFLAFMTKQEIPLAPITLIFGANSSGKSSVMRSLRMIHEHVKENGSNDGEMIDFNRRSYLPHNRHYRENMEVGVWWDKKDPRTDPATSQLEEDPGRQGIGLGNKGTVDDKSLQKLVYLVNKDNHAEIIRKALRTRPLLVESLTPLLIDDFASMVHIPAQHWLLPHMVGEAVRRQWHDYPELHAFVQDDENIEVLNSYMKQFGDEYRLIYLAHERFNRSLWASVFWVGDPLITEHARPMEVGTGTRSLIEMLVYIIPSYGKIILAEEPESHLHPAMQARLASMFVELYQERKNQFIIETHSEHLIRRIQSQIRHGVVHPEAYKDPKKILTRDDVSILHVERGKDGTESHVRKMELDEMGEFIEPWPDDFFDLSYNEGSKDYWEAMRILEQRRG